MQDSVIVLVNCKNEKDPIKDEGARMATILNINFSDAKGQLIHSLGLDVADI